MLASRRRSITTREEFNGRETHGHVLTIGRESGRGGELFNVDDLHGILLLAGLIGATANDTERSPRSNSR